MINRTLITTRPLIPPARPLRVLAPLHVNLPVVLLAVVFSFEAVCARTTAPLILAIE